MSMQHYRRVRGVRGLSMPERLVLWCLADHADSEGRAWPSVEAICEELEIGRTSVFTAIRVLKARGLVAADWAPGKRGARCFPENSPPSAVRNTDGGLRITEDGSRHPDDERSSSPDGLAYKEYEPSKNHSEKEPRGISAMAHASAGACDPARPHEPDPRIERELVPQLAESAELLQQLHADAAGKLRLGQSGAWPPFPEELQRFHALRIRHRTSGELLRSMGAALKAGEAFWQTKGRKAVSLRELFARDGELWLELAQKANSGGASLVLSNQPEDPLTRGERLPL